MLKLVKREAKRTPAIESTRTLRILSGGIKLSDLLVKDMGIKLPVKGDDESERSYVHFAEDEATEDVYLYVTSEPQQCGRVSLSKSFTNSTLLSALLRLADLAGDYKVGKGQPIVAFTVDKKVEFEGSDFFKVSFKEIMSTSSENEEENTTDAPSTESTEEAVEDVL